MMEGREARRTDRQRIQSCMGKKEKQDKKGKKQQKDKIALQKEEKDSRKEGKQIRKEEGKKTKGLKEERIK